jgi:hypothetical protein
VEASIGSEVYLRDPWGNDTLIQGGNDYLIQFWESEADSSAFVPNRANQYLQSGWVHALDTVRIQVSYNPVIFDFFDEEFSVEIIEGDSVEIEYLLNGIDLLEEGLVTSVVIGDKEQLFVYPNPASEIVKFSTGDVTLYDTQGLIVETCTNCSTLDVGHLSSGVYFLRIAGKGSPVRLVVQ